MAGAEQGGSLKKEGFQREIRFLFLFLNVGLSVIGENKVGGEWPSYFNSKNQ